MRERYDDLLGAGKQVQTAQYANRVRHALRAHLLGFDLADEDRRTLQRASASLDRVLRVVDAPPQVERVASLVDDGGEFRTVREAWDQGSAVDRATLIQLRDTLRDLASKKPDGVSEQDTQAALDFFARLATNSLRAFHAAESRSEDWSDADAGAALDS